MTSEVWNNRYQAVTQLPAPCQGLVSYRYLLPTTGTALDLACGLGANALLLAQQGLETYAWDYAKVAIDRLRTYTQTQSIRIHTEVRDVIAFPPPPAYFDVIVVCRFLERRLIPALISALKCNGLLFYQTFTDSYINDKLGPRNPEFRLADNELLHWFSDLQIVVYNEERDIGNITQGFRNEALLIAQKRR